MRQNIRVLLAVVAVVIGIYLTNFVDFSKEKPAPVHRRDASWDLLFQQNRLEKEGKAVEKSLQFDLAKEKYKQAIEIGKRMTPRQDYWRPTLFYTRVLQKEGKYEEALEEMSELSKSAPENKWFYDTKKELETLVKARALNDVSSIRQYIESFKEKYAAGLPPKGIGDIIRITTILRLYDTIADYEAGIAYIDEIVDFLKQRRKSKNDRSYILYDLKTSQEAITCMNRPRPNPDLNGCRFMRDYLLVREGFEQDKAEGRKNCINAKPGEICMGRATKALIASDYFIW